MTRRYRLFGLLSIVVIASVSFPGEPYVMAAETVAASANSDAVAHLETARGLEQQRKFKEALTQLDAALKLDPRNASIWNVHGRLLARLGRLKEAAKSVERATEIDGKRVAYWRALGNLDLMLLDEKRAAAAYEHVVMLDQKDADAWYYLGIIHLKREDGQRARQCLLRAVELNPNRSDFHCELGYVYHCMRHGPLAEKHYKTALKLDSSNKVAAERLQLLRKPVSPENCTSPVLVMHDPVKVAAKKLGGSLVDVLEKSDVALGPRESKGALQALKDAIKKDPASVDLHWRLANTYIKLGKNAEAIEECRTVTHLQPKDPSSWMFLGVLAERCGDSSEALFAQRKAYQLNPTTANAVILISAQRKANKTAEADKFWKQISEEALRSKKSSSLIELLQSCLIVDLYSRETRELAKTALLRMPKSAEVLRINSLTTWAAGDKHGAIELLKKSIKIEPKKSSQTILSNMQWELTDKRDLAGSLKTLQLDKNISDHEDEDEDPFAMAWSLRDRNKPGTGKTVKARSTATPNGLLLKIPQREK